MTIRIPVLAATGAISQSVRDVLRARGFQICDGDGQPIAAAELEKTLGEFGKNAAQCLVSLDSSAENA